MEDISRFKCPYIPKDQIWQAAENFRDEFWPESTLPVDIERMKRGQANNRMKRGQANNEMSIKIKRLSPIPPYSC